MGVQHTEDFELEPHRVHEALLREAVWNRYAELTAAVDFNFQHCTDPDTLSTSFRRSMPTDPLPSVLRNRLGPTVDVTEQVSWKSEGVSKNCAGDLHVTIVRPAVIFRGELDIRPAGRGSQLLVSGGTPSMPWYAKPFTAQVEDIVTTALRKLCQAVRDDSKDML